MFSGIVQHLGAVASAEIADFGRVVVIDPRGWAHRPAPGESVAVNGCCLTLVDDPGGAEGLRFELMHQTLGATTLGDLMPGDPVNLEPAVTPSTLLSGHIVQGHVDGVGVVGGVTADDGERRIRIEPPPQLLDFVVDKGSVAVDGVSLTVATLAETWFEVALIPTTIAATTLGRCSEGDRVNLETDYLVKATVRWLTRAPARSP